MTLYAKYAELRDRFEILAFHDATVKTFAELDEKLAPIIEERWDGKELPFPVLLDPTRKTIKAFGISAYPTNVLIDPEGKVVRGNAEKLLEAKLRDLSEREPSDGEEEDERAP